MDESVPGDWCYVNNFEDPYCPKSLKLPKGQARIFKAHIQEFINRPYFADEGL